MRTRNFRVRSDVVKRGAVTKSQKGKKAYVERKVAECFQWKSHGQCSKGDSCSFGRNRLASGNSGKGQGRKGRSSDEPNSKAKTDGEGDKSTKEPCNRDESSSDKKSEIPRRCRNCNNPSCSSWYPPVCQNYKSEKGCMYGDICHFRHVEAEEKPSKKSKKGGAKGSIALLKESTQLGCVSQDSYSRTSILRDKGKLGSKHAVKFSKGTRHQIKIWERKSPSQGII